MTKKQNDFYIEISIFTEDNELIEENLKFADLFYEKDIYLRIVARKSTINILQNKIPKEYKDKIKLLDRSSETKDKIKVLKRKVHFWYDRYCPRRCYFCF